MKKIAAESLIERPDGARARAEVRADSMVSAVTGSAPTWPPASTSTTSPTSSGCRVRWTCLQADVTRCARPGHGLTLDPSAADPYRRRG